MNLDPATTTIICTTLTALGLQIVGYLREGRAHRWMVEQSDRDRRERLQTAEELKQQHVAVATTLAENTQQAASVLSQKIDENTAFNVAAIAAGEKAYTEANNLSLKIQQQGLELRAPSRQSDRVEPV